MTRKFTQEELAQARVQMAQEAEEAYQLAARAAKWLEIHTAPLGVSVNRQEVFMIYPHLDGLQPCWLTIDYCDYDSDPNDWLKDRLQPMDPTPYTKHRPQDGWFILELGLDDGFPDGAKFYCRTSYYDSHASGW